MAAGDILLTIKAKYESVDAAYVAVKGIQDAITGINKTKLDIKGIQGVAVSAKDLAKQLGVVEKRFSQFSGKTPWGIKTLSNQIFTLEKQLSGAAFQLGNNRKELNRKNAALTLVAGAYKKARLELIAYAQVQKQLFRSSKITRRAFKEQRPSDWMERPYGMPEPNVRKAADYPVPQPRISEARKYEEVKPYQDFLAALRAEGGEFEKRIKVAKDGLKGDAELRKRWNSTERTEWKETEKQSRAEERKVLNNWKQAQEKFLTEQKANIAADKKNLQDWVSAKSKHQTDEIKRRDEIFNKQRKYDTDKANFDQRENERIKKLQGKKGLSRTQLFGDIEAMNNRMRDIALKPASLGKVELALKQIEPLMNWAIEDTEEWNMLTKTQNMLMEKRVELQKKLRGEQVVSKQRSALGPNRGVFTRGPNTIGIPAYDDADATEKGSMFKMASDLQRFQTGKEQKSLAQILEMVATRPIDAVVKELKADFDQLGGAINEATSDIDKFRKGVGRGSRKKSDYVRDGKWGFYGDMTAEEKARDKLYDPINYGKEGELYKWRAEKRATMFTPEARASRRQRAQKTLRRRNLGNMLGGKNAQNFLLGGGFPMLFGGGAGSVGGSLMGSGLAAGLGIPGGGFGLQIAGSAIGTIIEGSIRKTKELGDALADLNMDKLVESGIRLSSQLQIQVELLEKQGKYAEARALMEEQVYEQTGANKEVLKDISGAVNIISAEWNDFANSGGVLLGVVFAPVLVALGGILKFVTEIFKMFNAGMSEIRNGIGVIYNLLPPDLRTAWEEHMKSMDSGLQKARASSASYNHELMDNIANLERIIRIESQIKPGYTIEDRIHNLRTKGLRTEGDIDKERSKLWTQKLQEHGKAWSDDREIWPTAFSKDTQKIFGNKTEKTTVGEALKRIVKFNFDKETDLIKSKELFTPGVKELEKLEAQKEELLIKAAFADERFTRRNTADHDIITARMGHRPQEAKRLEFRQKILDITSKENELKEIAKNKDIDISKSVEYTIKLRELGNEKMKAELELSYLLTDEQVKLNNLYAQIGKTIENGMVSAIEAAIEGTKTLGEIAANVFRSIARMLLQYGISTGLGNLGGPGSNWSKFFTGRASGGPVTGGKPYIVGEKGPELFVPGSSGGIVPNHAMGGSANVTVNVDAGGSSVQGDAGQAQALGRMLGNAIQEELIRQKRPGGLLTY